MEKDTVKTGQVVWAVDGDSYTLVSISHIYASGRILIQGKKNTKTWDAHPSEVFTSTYEALAHCRERIKALQKSERVLQHTYCENTYNEEEKI